MLNFKNTILWILRLLAAAPMMQSLFFKFSGAEESIYIFSTLGIEPWGRIAAGVTELIAAVLLLIPRATWLGALVGMMTMSGAIFFHLTKLGIEVYQDGGQLFIYAVVTWSSCVLLVWLERAQIQNIVNTVTASFKK